VTSPSYSLLVTWQDPSNTEEEGNYTKPKSKALVKEVNGKLEVRQEGLAELKKIKKGDKYIIRGFVGEYRSGKSYLASASTGYNDVFESNDSCRAVTEGIDVFVQEYQGVWHVTLDCEGTSDASSTDPARSKVLSSVLLWFAMELVYVVDTKFTDTTWSQLGDMIRLKKIYEKGVPDHERRSQFLTMLVNMNRLQFDRNYLETELHREDPENVTRTEARKLVREKFSPEQRSLRWVPDLDKQKEATRSEYLEKVRQEFYAANVESATGYDGDKMGADLRAIILSVEQKGSINAVALEKLHFNYDCIENEFQKDMQQLPYRPETIYQKKMKEKKDECIERFHKNNEVNSQLHSEIIAEREKMLKSSLDKIGENLLGFNKENGETAMKSANEQLLSDFGKKCEENLSFAIYHPNIKDVLKIDEFESRFFQKAGIGGDDLNEAESDSFVKNFRTQLHDALEKARDAKIEHNRILGEQEKTRIRNVPYDGQLEGEETTEETKYKGNFFERFASWCGPTQTVETKTTKKYRKMTRTVITKVNGDVEYEDETDTGETVDRQTTKPKQQTNVGLCVLKCGVLVGAGTVAVLGAAPACAVIVAGEVVHVSGCVVFGGTVFAGGVASSA